MAGNLQKLAEIHSASLAQIPGLSLERIRACKYLHEFDRELQCPTWGYPTEGAYYRDATSVDALLDVKVPLFIINATDDPVSINRIFFHFQDADLSRLLQIARSLMKK